MINLYCRQCGHHQPIKDVRRKLEDDLKEHFYCKECNVEMVQEFEMEDNNLDDMQEALDEVTALRRQLTMAENKFIEASDQYFAAWNIGRLNGRMSNAF